MAVCSFLGHRDIYEKDIYARLLRAVHQIAAHNDEIEFLFYNNGCFYDLCLAAALEVKQHYPQKSIMITWVVHAEDLENVRVGLRQYEAALPVCVIDKIISPPFCPVPSDEKDFIARHKKLERWAIQQSTHLISYLYHSFCEAENRQYTYAQNRGLAVIDVTCRETSQYILEQIDVLPEQKQFILKNMIQGQAQKEIANLLNVTHSALCQALKHGCRKLRSAAKKRLCRSLQQALPPPVRCSIFTLGPITYESLSSFEQAVLFVLDRYHVTQFYIAPEYCSSGYMSVLKRLSKAHYREMQIIAITHYPQMDQEQWVRILTRFCPPCHTVKNIDTHAKRLRSQIFRATKAMIEQSDFSICNLSENPFADSIKKHASTTKGAKILDLGKKEAEVG